MVLVKYVDEVFKIRWGVVPDSPDIVQVSVLCLWKFVALVKYVFFAFGHVDVGVSCCLLGCDLPLLLTC